MLPVVVDSGSGGANARKHTCAGWIASRRSTMSIGEKYASFRKPVQVRRVHPGRPPKQLAQSFRSSTAIKRMFGGGFFSEQDVVQRGRAIAEAPSPMFLMKSRRDLFTTYPNRHLTGFSMDPGIIGDGRELAFFGGSVFDNHQSSQQIREEFRFQ